MWLEATILDSAVLTPLHRLVFQISGRGHFNKKHTMWGTLS